MNHRIPKNNKLDKIKQLVKECAGKISTVHYEKVLEPKKTVVKKHGELPEIRKTSVFQVRAGIDYENIQTIKEKHESGEIERRGLPASMEKIDTGIYHHLYKKSYYIGVAPVDNPNSIKEATYLVGGVETNLDDIIVEDLTLRDVLYAKDLKGHDDTEWMQLSWDNIKSLTGVK